MSAECQSGCTFQPAIIMRPPSELWCMVGRTSAAAMRYGIACESFGPQVRPSADHRGELLLAAPSRIAGSTSTQSTVTYEMTQIATSSSTDPRFQIGNAGSQ